MSSSLYSWRSFLLSLYHSILITPSDPADWCTILPVTHSISCTYCSFRSCWAGTAGVAWACGCIWIGWPRDILRPRSLPICLYSVIFLSLLIKLSVYRHLSLSSYFYLNFILYQSVWYTCTYNRSLERPSLASTSSPFHTTVNDILGSHPSFLAVWLSTCLSISFSGFYVFTLLCTCRFVSELSGPGSAL